jgi:hypothetical protein
MSDDDDYDMWRKMKREFASNWDRQLFEELMGLETYLMEWLNSNENSKELEDKILFAMANATVVIMERRMAYERLTDED